MATADQIAAIRAIIGDDKTPYVFTDQQISAMFTAAGESLYMSSAILLERIAVDEALLYRYIKTDDLTVDGTKTAEILLKRAARLRDQAEDEDEAALSEAFTLVFPLDECTTPEYAEVCFPWL